MLNSSENCPICQNTSLGTFPYKSYELWHCPSCSFRFLPSKKRSAVRQEDMFNSPFEFWSTPENYAKAQSLFHYYFKKRHALIKRFLSAPLNLLDVGCGHALWIRYLLDLGEQCEGLEPTKHSLDFVTHNLTFEDFKPQKKYNCLTIIDVLEHVSEPKTFLEKAHSLLEDKGLLFVQVPSVFGLKIPWGHDAGLPFHFWHFELSSLKLLLEKSGFEVLHVETGILGVVGRELRQGKIYGWQKLLWQLSSYLKCGNRLQVLARRKDH